MKRRLLYFAVAAFSIGVLEVAAISIGVFEDVFWPASGPIHDPRYAQLDHERIALKEANAQLDATLLDLDRQRENLNRLQREIARTSSDLQSSSRQ
jgi:hypothetical protein